MNGRPFPISRYLTPATPPPGQALAAPQEFTSIRQSLRDGLPATLALDGTTSVTLTLPAGVGRAWRDMDAYAVVSSSADELAASEPISATPAGVAPPFVVDGKSPPLRMNLRRNDTLVAGFTLTAGVVLRLPDGGIDPTRGVAIELVILGWELRAGTVRSAGDFGSWLSLAWCVADQAVPHFSTPPPDIHVEHRLPPDKRLQSKVGRYKYLRVQDLSYKFASRAATWSLLK